jgi:cytochrome c553
MVAVLLAFLGAAVPDTATAQQLGEVASMCADCHGVVDASKLKALWSALRPAAT